MTRPLALTLGEPAGIGPDITLAAWLKRADLALPPFYLLADPDFLARRARAARPDHSAPRCRAGRRARGLSRRRCPSSRSTKRSPPSRDIPTHRARPAAIASIRRAVADVLAGPRARGGHQSGRQGGALSHRLRRAGPHRISRQASRRSTPARAAHPVMMLWSPDLAVVPVTIHLPVRDVPQRLTTELIVETGRIVARDLAATLRHRARRASRSPD